MNQNLVRTTQENEAIMERAKQAEERLAQTAAAMVELERRMAEKEKISIKAMEEKLRQDFERMMEKKMAELEQKAEQAVRSKDLEIQREKEAAQQAAIAAKEVQARLEEAERTKALEIQEAKRVAEAKLEEERSKIEQRLAFEKERAVAEALARSITQSPARTDGPSTSASSQPLFPAPDNMQTDDEPPNTSSSSQPNSTLNTSSSSQPDSTLNASSSSQPQSMDTRPDGGSMNAALGSQGSPRAPLPTSGASRRQDKTSIPKPMFPPGRRQAKSSQPSPARPARQPPVNVNVDSMTPADALKFLVNHVMSNKGPGSPGSPRRRRNEPPAEYKASITKPREEGRNELLTWVRKMMNACIGISKDKDIAALDSEDSQAERVGRKQLMQLYEKKARGALGPDLEPMYPNWDLLKGLWNRRLCELFIEYCRENYGEDELSEEDEEEIEGIFFARLTTLRGILRSNTPRKDESEEQAAERNKGRAWKSAKRNREHNRRRDLFFNRGEAGGGGEEDDNVQMVLELGVDGMSSDESADEDDGRVYTACELPWRSSEITRRLIIRDEELEKQKLTIYGAKQGNPGRKRRRLTPGPPSKRPAPPGKPINFYKSSWYNALSDRQRMQLKAGPRVEMKGVFHHEGNYVGFDN